jgi:hypothetical protein
MSVRYLTHQARQLCAPALNLYWSLPHYLVGPLGERSRCWSYHWRRLKRALKEIGLIRLGRAVTVFQGLEFKLGLEVKFIVLSRGLAGALPELVRAAYDVHFLRPLGHGDLILFRFARKEKPQAMMLNAFRRRVIPICQRQSGSLPLLLFVLGPTWPNPEGAELLPVPAPTEPDPGKVPVAALPAPAPPQGSESLVVTELLTDRFLLNPAKRAGRSNIQF